MVVLLYLTASAEAKKINVGALRKRHLETGVPNQHRESPNGMGTRSLKVRLSVGFPRHVSNHKNHHTGIPIISLILSHLFSCFFCCWTARSQ